MNEKSFMDVSLGTTHLSIALVVHEHTRHKVQQRHLVRFYRNGESAVMPNGILIDGLTLCRCLSTSTPTTMLGTMAGNSTSMATTRRTMLR